MTDRQENARLIAALFGLFVLVQALGIYLGAKLIGIPEFVPESNPIAGAGMFGYILVSTVIILLIIRYARQLLKVLEIISIFVSTEIFFELLFMGILPAELGFWLAIVLAGTIAASRVLFINVLTQDVAMTLSIIGIGALLGASLTVMPALILIGLIAVYDVVAVFQTKHMVTLAKAITEDKLAFTIAIPTKDHVFQLGGGDLVMPLIFTVSVLRDFGLGSAIATMLGGMIALIALFAYVVTKPGKAWPAMPPIAVGVFAGFGLSLLLRGLF